METRGKFPRVDFNQHVDIFAVFTAQQCPDGILAPYTATSIAHQARGAIGFTEEYSLQLVTRHMMSWRSEYGNSRYWAVRLCSLAAKLDGAGLWKDMTWRSDSDQSSWSDSESNSLHRRAKELARQEPRFK